MQTVTGYFKDAAGKASFIRKMFEKGLELKATFGADAVCDFSLGNPDVPPPAAAAAALHAIADDAVKPLGLGYCPNAGIPAVRAAMAERAYNIVDGMGAGRVIEAIMGADSGGKRKK